jgi:Na+/proline symporter
MTFSPVEYVVFFGMLGVSALIGVYFGLIKGHQDTVVEYMLGGKKMSVIPVSLSLLAG